MVDLAIPDRLQTHGLQDFKHALANGDVLFSRRRCIGSAVADVEAAAFHGAFRVLLVKEDIAFRFPAGQLLEFVHFDTDFRSAACAAAGEVLTRNDVFVLQHVECQLQAIKIREDGPAFLVLYEGRYSMNEGVAYLDLAITVGQWTAEVLRVIQQDFLDFLQRLIAATNVQTSHIFRSSRSSVVILVICGLSR